MKRVNISYGYLWLIVVLVILGKIFFVWFTSPETIGGDWPTYSQEFLQERKFFPSLWSSYRGLGGAVTPVLNLETFQAFLIVPWVNWLGLPWSLVYRVGWFGLFLVLGIVSSLTLSGIIIFGPSRRWVQAVSVLIYLTNTYVLMLLSGGQMGVALAYALFPLVLFQFIKLGNYVLLEKKFVAGGILTAGFVLSLEIVFDVRLAYLAAAAVALYWLFLMCWQLFHRDLSEKGNKLNPRLIIISMTVPISLAFLLNAFWLLPAALTASRTVSELGAIYTSSSSVPFFSFADFSHTLSLLHPNWPENIFGKTYFLQPGFLLLPIIAFASLLFISKKNKSDHQFSLVYFNLLALVGIFLAKGANEPLGGIYIWLFDHIPGFVMFRDPTKWYVYIATSYAVLIPFAAEMMISLIKDRFAGSKGMSVLGNVMRLMVVFVWIALIWQAFFGKLGGTLQHHDIPKEYTRYAKFIADQPNFFRTLWVPKQPRFSPVSDLHPTFSSEFITSASVAAEFVKRFDKPDTRDRLTELAVKYIVIPYDALGEIFLDDRHYDPKQRAGWDKYLDGVGWIKKLSADGITVYETSKYNDHFWVTGGKISGYRMISPDRYDVSLTAQTPTVLYFSERFHPGWRLRFENETIVSKKTPSGLNSFVIPRGFTGDIQVFFYPEVYAKWGRIVSIVTLAGVAAFVMLQSQRRKEKL